MSSQEEEGYRSPVLREFEFLTLLTEFLPQILNTSQIIREPRLDKRRPDFIATLPSGREAIIEAKSVTPNTQRRLLAVVDQLKNYGESYSKVFPRNEPPELMLAVPGTFSAKHVDFIHANGIDRIIDGIDLRNAGASVQYPEALAESEETQPQSQRQKSRELLQRLNLTPPGRAEWSTYQALCGDILAFLLCPPLSNPIGEVSNWTRINRRDFVLPNYANRGFWEYMRVYYNAHYIIVDAKNYVGNVKKKEILQLANYLSEHGAGLFGVITCRNGGDRSAELTRREQWVLHRKLIIILNDDDLRQMISLRTSDADPADLIRQKIEDFRLGF